MTLIELSEQDAKLFVLFQQHYEEFALLVDNRVFDVKNGSAELHFNRGGQIVSIDLHAKVFRRATLVDSPVVIVKPVV